jgi:general transcription factor 3C polypeptide 3 (transcription factor C subunit 4)
LLFASLAGTIRSADAFINTAFQKHILREIRIADAAVKNKDQLVWIPNKKRYGVPRRKGKAVVVDEDEDDEDEDNSGDEVARGFVPAKHNPVLLALYGQMTNVARSYQSSICMWSFVRAYQLHS